MSRAREVGGTGEQLLPRAVEENVLEGLTNLAAYPVVARALSAGRVRLHGWVYDLVEALVRVYDPARDEFVLADQISPP